MTSHRQGALALAAALILSAPAQALTVKEGGTGADGDGAIAVTTGSAVDCGSCPGVWNTDVSPIAPSSWELIDVGAAATWEFAFDLTGYDVTTAVLSVDWSADNFATTWLNGVQLTGAGTEITGGTGANYTNLLSFVVGPASALFEAGANSLEFRVTGDGNTDGLRAAARIEASAEAVVPLPAAAPLLAAGLGALAAVARRRRRLG
ncbi:MAG: VPLPA-CTERM sorting domain-containing protein [Pseudomonadota bacterium]|nr:VPLPA-CTERM sorting domain-containing protein [Pseudomonadota bacterium]